MKPRQFHTWVEHLFFVFILAMLGWIFSIPGDAKNEWHSAERLTVSVLDVGQGDSIFVETPEGKQMLIDGGPDDTVLSKIGRLMPWNDRTIELVVLTHPHADHVSGLISILERYRVEKIIRADVAYPSVVSDAFQKEIEEHLIQKETVTEPMDFYFGGTEVRILAPNHSFAGEHPSNMHDAMIILKLTFGAIDFLLTGDMESEGEIALLESNADLKAEILKVGHHGSKTSTTKEFLEAVDPDYAVISSGKENRYGHPHPSVLFRLQNFGADIFRTDERGTITFVTDGSNIKAITEY